MTSFRGCQSTNGPQSLLGIKPIKIDTANPMTMPTRKGITFKKPFALIEIKAITNIVMIDTTIIRQSYKTVGVLPQISHVVGAK